MPRGAIWNVLFHFVNEKLSTLRISILVQNIFLELLCANVQCAERKDICFNADRKFRIYRFISRFNASF